MFSTANRPPRPRSIRLAKPNTWALVGSESLMGREVRDLFSEAHLPVDLKLIAEAAENAGTLTVQGDEPALVLGLESDTLRAASVAFLAGSPRIYPARP